MFVNGIVGGKNERKITIIVNDIKSGKCCERIKRIPVDREEYWNDVMGNLP